MSVDNRPISGGRQQLIRGRHKPHCKRRQTSPGYFTALTIMLSPERIETQWPVLSSAWRFR